MLQTVSCLVRCLWVIAKLPHKLKMSLSEALTHHFSAVRMRCPLCLNLLRGGECSAGQSLYTSHQLLRNPNTAALRPMGLSRADSMCSNRPPIQTPFNRPYVVGPEFEYIADVVFGVQAGARRGGIMERTTGDLFYRLFNVLSTIQIPRNVLTIRLMTRPYVNALTSLGDREMYMAGLMSFAGFRQLGVPVDKESKGTRLYSILRRIALLVNAVTSFSNKPLRWIFYLSVGVLILSGIAIGLLLLRKALGGTLEGWASVMASVWHFGGLILFCLGIVGIYLGKVHAEVKRRPLTMVRRVHQADGLEHQTDA